MYLDVDFSVQPSSHICPIEISELDCGYQPLQAIITGILLVHTNMKLEPGRLEYDLFLDCRDQIIIHLSPLRVNMI